ncbi:hypothetical protein PVAP13_9KG611101 [Panicum virgatum]|uniref:Uncharacterized protein n=1 Tax=Panicum virgatum TaxID=38727 RepID=A0A8T0P2I6_PANVG|nr:hypothetical protein PVAP13_9KG611101 [Panicum virgatum]
MGGEGEDHPYRQRPLPDLQKGAGAIRFRAGNCRPDRGAPIRRQRLAALTATPRRPRARHCYATPPPPPRHHHATAGRFATLPPAARQVGRRAFHYTSLDPLENKYILYASTVEHVACMDYRLNTDNQCELCLCLSPLKKRTASVPKY